MLKTVRANRSRDRSVVCGTAILLGLTSLFHFLDVLGTREYSPCRRQRCLSRRCYSVATHFRFQQRDLDKLFLGEVASPVACLGPYLGLVFGLSQWQALGRWWALIVPTLSPPAAALPVSWREVFCRVDGGGMLSGRTAPGPSPLAKQSGKGRSGRAVVFPQAAEALWDELEEARPQVYPSRCPELPL